MLKALLNFEFIYQLKQRFFLGFSLIFLFFGYSTGNNGYSLETQTINSAYQISYNIALLSLGCMFAIMFFAISGMLRDRRYQIESIIYSTAIKKRTFFFSRLLGVLGFSLLVFSFSLVGFMLGNLTSNVPSERLADFNLVHYLWTWLIIVLPNVFICTSVVFSVCTLTKNNIATYISAISIYALYMICSIYLNSPLLANSVPPSPENLVWAALADPFGLSAFFEQTQYWTVFQKNTQLISFSGYFMWNRIIWMFISTIILVTTYRFFSFRKLHQKAKKSTSINPEKIQVKTYQPASSIILNRQSSILSFLSLLKIELKNVFISLPFIALSLIWMVIVFTEIYTRINHGGNYNDSLYPTTNLMVWLIEEPFVITSLILIIFYSGEMIWRERSINFDSIIDSTPVSNIVLLLSKLSTLILLPAFLIFSSILIAIGFQISKGYYQFEIGQYLAMFYYSGVPMIFFSILAFFIQSLTNNKYLGMVITGLIIILFGGSMAATVGIYHPLLIIGHFPKVVYTNMTGYGDFSGPFHYFSSYWISLGGILILLSFKLWRRGNIHQFSFRLRQLITNWKRWQLINLVVFIFLFIASGSAIFYNTNVATEFQTPKDRLDYREAYERKFKKYESLGRLFPVSIKTEVDLFPDQSRYSLKADYLVENRSDTIMHQVFISSKEFVKNMSLENAVLIEHDTFFNTYLFQMIEPLHPRQPLKYSFELIHEKKGFKTHRTLVNNGTYITHTGLGPALNYQSGKEITSHFERQKRSLPKREIETTNEDHLHLDEASIGKMPFETIVSTQADQIALAPGNLIRQWTEGNRNYFHYRSNDKITPLLGYFSANYKLKKINHQGISIEQYYHPGHDYNIDVIEKSTKQALDYCIGNFGAYPFDHLRIAEIPGHWNFGGQAMPGTISMVEDRMYLIDNRNPEGFDLVAKRTIHEVAHQWWGGVFLPKMAAGGSFFLEGFAKYTEAVVMEKTHGKGAIWQLSETSNRRYFRGRTMTAEPEPPLYFADGQDYLSYGKSYTVLLAMKELIGEAQVNTAIRHMLNKHKEKIEPTATTLELLEEFYQLSPPEYHRLIDDWFKRIITYDLAVETVTYEKLMDGRYQIMIDISAKREEENGIQAAIPLPIDEPIQIGLFDKHPKAIGSDDPILYLKAHQINQEEMQLEVIVDELPAYIAIDPFGTRLDADRMDNFFELEF